MAFVMRRRVALLLVSAAVITGLTGGAGRTRSGEAGRAIPWGCRENGIPHGDSARTGGRSACGAGRLDKICLERGVSGEAALDGAGGLSLRLRGGRMVSMPEKYYKKRKVSGARVHGHRAPTCRNEQHLELAGANRCFHGR